MLYKTGHEIGFYAVPTAQTLDDAQAIAQRETAGEALFDLKTVPVNPFPHFD
ncbi:MAG: hypothetical protein JO090_03215 [Rhizobacter sp.]|nr:hypothetical protein [Rhizobacter sp.]